MVQEDLEVRSHLAVRLYQGLLYDQVDQPIRRGHRYHDLPYVQVDQAVPKIHLVPVEVYSNIQKHQTDQSVQFLFFTHFVYLSRIFVVISIGNTLRLYIIIS